MVSYEGKVIDIGKQLSVNDQAGLLVGFVALFPSSLVNHTSNNTPIPIKFQPNYNDARMLRT
jgi:hypothetical protein